MPKGYRKEIKLCEYCGEQIARCHIGQKYHKECAQAAYKKRKNTRSANLSIEQREKRNKHQRWLTYKNRQNTINHYGGKCECCGENRLEFLCIDHINGDGYKHRKENHMTGGAATVNWLIKHNFPEGFRVLCFNCNMSYGFFGYCPHKVNQSRDSIASLLR